MELIINGNTLPTPVTPELIAESILSLTGEGDSFAILAKGDQHYIQTSGGPVHGFVLEFRDGSEETHFSCSNSSLSADDITRAFQSYLAEDDRWRTEFEWESQEHNFSTAPGRKTTLLSGIASLVVGLPLLALGGLGGVKSFNDPPSMSIWITFLVAGFFGLLLTSAGVRLVLNRPRSDGSLLSPTLLGVAGAAFAAFAAYLIFASPCSSCTGNTVDMIIPAVFLLFLAALCLKAALRKWRRPHE